MKTILISIIIIGSIGIGWFLRISYDLLKKKEAKSILQKVFDFSFDVGGCVIHYENGTYYKNPIVKMIILSPNPLDEPPSFKAEDIEKEIKIEADTPEELIKKINDYCGY